MAVAVGDGRHIAQEGRCIQVCVLLPDTSSSVRWVQFDAPIAQTAFKGRRHPSITNALNDAQKQVAQAQACLAAGAKVVIETMIDPGSAAAIEKLFTDKGGKAIDYDRLVPNSTASAYITFDGNKVGRAQAPASSPRSRARRSRSSLSSGAARPTRSGLVQERKRRHPEPAVQEREDREGPAAVRARLDGQRRGERVFAQMLVKTNNKIDGVIAANDNIAGAVVAQLKAKHLKPIPLSGQDATVEGAQYIISGWQTGTVYKPVPLQGERGCRGCDRAPPWQEAGHDHDQE